MESRAAKGVLLVFATLVLAGCTTLLRKDAGPLPAPSVSSIVVDPPAQPFCPKLPPPNPATPIVHIGAGDIAALLSVAQDAEPGTTVLLADGLYTLSPGQSIEVRVSRLVIRSESGNRDAVIIQGGQNNIVVRASGVILADMTLRQPRFHNVQLRGELGLSDDRLYNLHLLDAGKQFVKVNAEDGSRGRYADHGLVACSLIEYTTFSKGTDVSKPDYTNGVDILAGKGWVIRDTMFRRIRSEEGPAGPAILAWKNSLETKILRNVIVDSWRGIALGLLPPDVLTRGGPHVLYDHQDGLVANNVFLAVHEPADSAIETQYARNTRIVHNTVFKREGLPHNVPWSIEYRFPPTTAIIENNLANQPIVKRDPLPLEEAQLAGNVTDAQAAWFRNVLHEDVHLVPDAPAIDQGVFLIDIPTDLDGEPRPSGSAFDPGADEFHPQ
jgi:hypothetical protein